VTPVARFLKAICALATIALDLSTIVPEKVASASRADNRAEMIILGIRASHPQQRGEFLLVQVNFLPI
jgi:hypothetical protein